MNTASILIKTDPQIKAKAQKTAGAMGLSLTSVINRYLKHFIVAKTITFGVGDEEIPNAHTLKVLRKAEENYKKGNTSPSFKTGEEAVKWLEEQGI